MGQGIKLAAGDNPELAAALEDMQDQLVLALIKRLGGKVTLPVSEIDATGHFILMMEADPMLQAFTFELKRKD
jgi:hypothetical protein